MLNEIYVLLWQQGWLWSILKGGFVTLALGVVGMMIGVFIAIPAAVACWRAVPLMSQAVHAYAVVVRGVPGLLVIYLLFFGSVQTVDNIGAFFGYRDGFKHAYGFIMGVFSIAVISSAYSIEVFRGALASIPRGSIEAARALGFSRFNSFRRVILPLMLRHAMSGINNVWQMTIKDTSLVSVVGLQELMRVSAIAAGITRSPLLFYVIAALVFLLITVLSQSGFGLAERTLNRGFAESRG